MFWVHEGSFENLLKDLFGHHGMTSDNYWVDSRKKILQRQTDSLKSRNLTNIQGVPKYPTHLFMTLYLLMVMDWETETAFILIPICVALKWVVNGLWRCWGTKVMVKTKSAIQIRKTHKVIKYRMIFNEWPKVNK